jgi:hypothetical protein
MLATVGMFFCLWHFWRYDKFRYVRPSSLSLESPQQSTLSAMVRCYFEVAPACYDDTDIRRCLVPNHNNAFLCIMCWTILIALGCLVAFTWMQTYVLYDVVRALTCPLVHLRRHTAICEIEPLLASTAPLSSVERNQG